MARQRNAFGDGTPRLKVCDRYANSRLTNQFGEEIAFHERFVEPGRALIVNVMYTVCRGSCPGTSAALADLRKTLSRVFGRRLSIVSLSVDPERDTPKRLLNYAKIYGADVENPGLCEWQFLTGERLEVDSLRKSLGFFDLDPRIDADPTRHASTILFGNSVSDRWATAPSEISTRELVATIRRVAGFTFEERYGRPERGAVPVGVRRPYSDLESLP